MTHEGFIVRAEMMIEGGTLQRTVSLWCIYQYNL